MRGLGAFTFEIASNAMKPALFTSADFKKDLYEQRAERKHVHQVRYKLTVVFYLCSQGLALWWMAASNMFFRGTLENQKLKVITTTWFRLTVSVPKSQHSVFQKGFGMIFCNAVPIANACYLAKEVVSSAIDAFVKAVSDLTSLGYTLRLDFGFCTINVSDRNLNFKYNTTFNTRLNESTFENKVNLSEVLKSHIDLLFRCEDRICKRHSTGELATKINGWAARNIRSRSI